MKFVLEKLIDNLFASHHILTFFKFRVNYFLESFWSRAEAKTFVSSANILNDKALEQFGKSFMQIKNSTEPGELPCGIPHMHVIVCFDQTHFPICTYCCLFAT